MTRTLIATTAVAVALASPAYANRGQDVLKHRIFEATQRAISEGYEPLTFSEFKTMADDLANSKKRVMLPVAAFFWDNNGNGDIYPTNINYSGDGFDIDQNEVKKVPVLLDNAPKQLKARLMDRCSENGCSVIFLGSSVQCNITNAFNAVRHTYCLNVEMTYSTQPMLDEARAANESPVYSPPPSPAIRVLSPSAPPPATLAPPVQQAPTGGGGTSFEKGHSDRVVWERWFNSLTGEQREGASYWASVRSTSQRAPCQGSAEFMTGCVPAKAFLDPVDAQRLSDPAYRLGWNTYP